MRLLRKKRTDVDKSNILIPTHLGIIMDGNGRWAAKRKLPRSAGHVAGAKNFRKITLYCRDIGVKYLTVYAFSTENWQRPQREISTLLDLFAEYLEEALRDFQHENIKVVFLGDVRAFPDKLQSLIEKVEASSATKDGMVLQIAMNYGGRDEIMRACRLIAGDVKNGSLDVNDITTATISDHLYTKGVPDPDLIIRPSGEYRTSNFLLWQSAYAEYVIMDVLWPDFTPHCLDKALQSFSQRNRRFGGI